jgi:hypothetical protein
MTARGPTATNSAWVTATAAKQTAIALRLELGVTSARVCVRCTAPTGTTARASATAPCTEHGSRSTIEGEAVPARVLHADRARRASRVHATARARRASVRVDASMAERACASASNATTLRAMNATARVISSGIRLHSPTFRHALAQAAPMAKRVQSATASTNPSTARAEIITVPWTAMPIPIASGSSSETAATAAAAATKGCAPPLTLRRRVVCACAKPARQARTATTAAATAAEI